MTGDALRTQLAEVLAKYSTEHGLGTTPWEHDRLASTLLPLLAAARAEGAAEALRAAAHVLSTDSDEAIEVALGGVSYAARFLRQRASALSAHTTEGDPT